MPKPITLVMKAKRNMPQYHLLQNEAFQTDYVINSWILRVAKRAA